MLYPRVSLYALMLAAAGIPLYIHLPRFASVELGLGLGTLGVILMGIRLVDLFQDPAIGWAIDRWPRAQILFASAAALGLAIGFPLLFSTPQGPHMVLRLVAVLVLLFSSYSLGMILLYGRSATLATTPTPRALMTLAAFRETGMLVGVVLGLLVGPNSGLMPHNGVNLISAPLLAREAGIRVTCLLEDPEATARTVTVTVELDGRRHTANGE